MATSSSLENLILDFLEWLAAKPRSYVDVMSTWRTSCPQFPVWEEAVDRGYVKRGESRELGAHVALTPEGLAHLRMVRSAEWNDSTAGRT